ncbi:MAG TPA: SUMF1/EgtB/PvdO family nonheme iron enzyme [Phycisphaerales bacterium]|nr:SUMF1/EgtB/PvdO family nonheme iron enzyme [Phycisphaerales bacterium]
MCGPSDPAVRPVPTRYTFFLSVAALCGACATSARADIDPVSGIDFVTVGDVNNPAWTGGGFYTDNRGSVGYEFRIGRVEVTTSQWAEFMNAALDRPANDRLPHVFAPVLWSVQPVTPNNPGGQRFAVPAGNEMLPVGGVDWRTCAIYTNWLHNNKSFEHSAFLSGAYDVSTFGYLNGGSLFTDQITRSPGARYWIPSLDEAMKASHWDPNKQNPDGTAGGWWTYNNSSDSEPVYGPAGVIVNGQFATANAGWDGFEFPGHNPFTVPLGAYTGVTSPYGLFDTAGGTREWTEGVVWLSDEPLPRERLSEGSGWVEGPFSTDLIDTPGGSGPPNFPWYDHGLRIAAAVPSPTWGSVAMISALASLLQRRRRTNANGCDT